MPQTTVYPEHLRTIYYEGVKRTEYKPSEVEYISGKIICTCGKVLKHTAPMRVHRQSAYHIRHSTA